MPQYPPRRASASWRSLSSAAVRALSAASCISRSSEAGHDCNSARMFLPAGCVRKCTCVLLSSSTTGVGILDQEYQHVGIPAADMQVHNSLFVERAVPIPVDTGAVIPLGRTVTALDALDQLIKFIEQRRIVTHPSEIAPLLGVDALGLLFHARQSKAKRRSGAPHSFQTDISQLFLAHLAKAALTCLIAVVGRRRLLHQPILNGLRHAILGGRGLEVSYHRVFNR